MKNWLKNGWRVLARRQTSILSAAAVIGAAWGVSAVLGILRYRLLYGQFLVCCAAELDAYNAAFRLPDLVFQLVVIGALSAAFIPVFSKKLGEDEKEANAVASSFLTLLLTVFLGLAAVIFILARPLSELIARGFSERQIEMMVEFTRWLLLAQMFFLVSNFFTGVIQSHQRFLVPALSPAVYNLGIILGILFLAPAWGMEGVVWGAVLGAGLHLIIQLPLAFRLGFRWRWRWDWRRAEVREIVRLMLPRTAGLAVGQIEATIVVVFATALSAGSLSLFYLARSLANLPVNVLGVTVGQAALPMLSQVAGRERGEFNRLVWGAVLQVLFLVLPVTALLVVLRVPLVRIAFGTRNFPWQATLATGRTLALLSGMIVAGAVAQILTRSFYALGNTKLPLYLGVVAVAVDVGLSYWLVFSWGWGILGLAVALSVAALVQVVSLAVVLRRVTGEWGGGEWLMSAAKMGVATLVMAGVLWSVMRVLDRYVLNTAYVLPLIALTVVAGAVGGGMYLGLSYLLRIEQLSGVVGLIRRVGKWREVWEEAEEMIEPTPSATAESGGQL